MIATDASGQDAEQQLDKLSTPGKRQHERRGARALQPDRLERRRADGAHQGGCAASAHRLGDGDAGASMMPGALKRAAKK